MQPHRWSDIVAWVHYRFGPLAPVVCWFCVAGWPAIRSVLGIPSNVETWHASPPTVSFTHHLPHGSAIGSLGDVTKFIKIIETINLIHSENHVFPGFKRVVVDLC